MLPSQTAGKKTTFPCLLCSRRASCNGENRRLLFRGGPFRFTDRAGPRFWPQFRSDVQIRALMPASTISREVRFTCDPGSLESSFESYCLHQYLSLGYAGVTAGFLMTSCRSQTARTCASISVIADICQEAEDKFEARYTGKLSNHLVFRGEEGLRVGQAPKSSQEA